MTILWFLVLAALVAQGVWEMANLMLVGINAPLSISGLILRHREYALPLAVFYIASGGAVAAHLLGER